MIVETGFTEKLSFVEHRNNGFLAMFGCDGKFYATLFDEEHRISDFTLDVDVLIFPIIYGRSSSADLHKRIVRRMWAGRRCRFRFLHGASLRRREHNTLSTGNSRGRAVMITNG